MKTRKAIEINKNDIVREGKNQKGNWLFMERTRIATLQEVTGVISQNKKLYFLCWLQSYRIER